MNKDSKENKESPEAPDPIGNVLLYLDDIRTNQVEQNKLLSSISGGIKFFVVIAVLTIIIQACSILLG